MPYIKPDQRITLDATIGELADRIVELSRTMPEETSFAGLLNYSCTTLAARVIKGRFGRIRYGTIATVTGVFKNVADEFYRRLAAPYEDAQIDEKTATCPSTSISAATTTCTGSRNVRACERGSPPEGRSQEGTAIVSSDRRLL